MHLVHTHPFSAPPPPPPGGGAGGGGRLDAGAGPLRAGGAGAHLVPPPGCALSAGKPSSAWGREVRGAGSQGRGGEGMDLHSSVATATSRFLCLHLSFLTLAAFVTGCMPPATLRLFTPDTHLSHKMHPFCRAEPPVSGSGGGSSCRSGIPAQGCWHAHARTPARRLCGLRAEQGGPARQHFQQLHGCACHRAAWCRAVPCRATAGPARWQQGRLA